MSDFRRIAPDFLAAPQIAAADVAEAKAQGITLIVNNRPDGETDDQPDGAAIAAAAEEAGIAYRAIPVGGGGFGLPQVAAMADALDSAEGPVLAFCRSGTRSTLLWALARASRGEDPDTLARMAASAGYDCAPVRPVMDMLAGRAGETA